MAPPPRALPPETELMLAVYYYLADPPSGAPRLAAAAATDGASPLHRALGALARHALATAGDGMALAALGAVYDLVARVRPAAPWLRRPPAIDMIGASAPRD